MDFSNMDADAMSPILMVSTATFGALLALALLRRALSGPSSSPLPTNQTKEEVAGGDDSEDSEDLEKFPSGKLEVYFGSQTGTAEGFAHIIEREGKTKGFNVKVIDLEDMELKDIPVPDDSTKRRRSIFLMSTYGEGEPTDNAAEFIKFLKDRDDVPNLSGLDYCVFGLGNRQYEHFNAMGKLVDEKLEKVGAKRVMDVGVGDDDNALEDDFEEWKEKLWPVLIKEYSPEGAEAFNGGTEGMAVPELDFEVAYVKNKAAVSDFPLKKVPEHINRSTEFYFTSADCKVTTNRELRLPKDGGSTVHLEFDISHVHPKHISYNTADNLGVLPVNNSSLVKDVAKSLNLDLDATFVMKGKGSDDDESSFKHPFPTPATVNDCLSRYCDLSGPPKRSDLKVIAAYCEDEMDKACLLRLASKDGKAEFKEKFEAKKISLGELLTRNKFLKGKLNINLAELISLTPWLQPRYYTISSSSSVHPKSIHSTVGVLDKGVCSTYMSGLDDGSNIGRIFVRPSTFALPEDNSTPIIMVGPGTGVAPMRALLQEREFRKGDGENVMYFGCKSVDMDYLYRDEFEEWQENGTLHSLHLAFSRDQKEKVYVQHLLEKNSESTKDLILNKNAFVYICGATQMGADVVAVLVKHLGKKYVDGMSEKGRLVQELWA